MTVYKLNITNPDFKIWWHTGNAKFPKWQIETRMSEIGEWVELPLPKFNWISPMENFTVSGVDEGTIQINGYIKIVDDTNTVHYFYADNIINPIMVKPSGRIKYDVSFQMDKWQTRQWKFLDNLSNINMRLFFQLGTKWRYHFNTDGTFAYPDFMNDFWLSCQNNLMKKYKQTNVPLDNNSIMRCNGGTIGNFDRVCYSGFNWAADQTMPGESGYSIGAANYYSVNLNPDYGTQDQLLANDADFLNNGLYTYIIVKAGIGFGGGIDENGIFVRTGGSSGDFNRWSNTKSGFLLLPIKNRVGKIVDVINNKHYNVNDLTEFYLNVGFNAGQGNILGKITTSLSPNVIARICFLNNKWFDGPNGPGKAGSVFQTLTVNPGPNPIWDTRMIGWTSIISTNGSDAGGIIPCIYVPLLGYKYIFENQASPILLKDIKSFSNKINKYRCPSTIEYDPIFYGPDFYTTYFTTDNQNKIAITSDMINWSKLDNYEIKGTIQINDTINYSFILGDVRNLDYNFPSSYANLNLRDNRLLPFETTAWNNYNENHNGQLATSGNNILLGALGSGAAGVGGAIYGASRGDTTSISQNSQGDISYRSGGNTTNSSIDASGIRTITSTAMTAGSIGGPVAAGIGAAVAFGASIAKQVNSLNQIKHQLKAAPDIYNNLPYTLGANIVSDASLDSNKTFDNIGDIHYVELTQESKELQYYFTANYGYPLASEHPINEVINAKTRYNFIKTDSSFNTDIIALEAIKGVNTIYGEMSYGFEFVELLDNGIGLFNDLMPENPIEMEDNYDTNDTRPLPPDPSEMVTIITDGTQNNYDREYTGGDHTTWYESLHLKATDPSGILGSRPIWLRLTGYINGVGLVTPPMTAEISVDNPYSFVWSPPDVPYSDNTLTALANSIPNWNLSTELPCKFIKVEVSNDYGTTWTDITDKCILPTSWWCYKTLIGK